MWCAIDDDHPIHVEPRRDVDYDRSDAPRLAIHVCRVLRAFPEIAHAPVLPTTLLSLPVEVLDPIDQMSDRRAVLVVQAVERLRMIQLRQ